MKPEFSIIELIDIFIEKIYYFLSMIIIVLVISWYFISNLVPKYQLHHQSYQLDYLSEEKLIDLSLLKFYMRGIHISPQQGLIYLDQHIEAIKSHLTKKTGAVQDITRIIDQNINNKNNYLDKNKYYKYALNNMGHNYHSGDNVLNLYLQFEPKDENEIILYKQGMIDYIVHVHELAKDNFLNYYLNLNISHKKNYHFDLQYLNILIKEAESIEVLPPPMLLQWDSLSDYILSLYLKRADLKAAMEYLRTNDIILNNLEKEKDFNLLFINTDIDFISSKIDILDSKIIYLSAIFFSSIFYLIILLVLLGYRNK